MPSVMAQSGTSERDAGASPGGWSEPRCPAAPLGTSAPPLRRLAARTDLHILACTQQLSQARVLISRRRRPARQQRACYPARPRLACQAGPALRAPAQPELCERAGIGPGGSNDSAILTNPTWSANQAFKAKSFNLQFPANDTVIGIMAAAVAANPAGWVQLSAFGVRPPVPTLALSAGHACLEWSVLQGGQASHAQGAHLLNDGHAVNATPLMPVLPPGIQHAAVLRVHASMSPLTPYAS